MTSQAPYKLPTNAGKLAGHLIPVTTGMFDNSAPNVKPDSAVRLIVAVNRGVTSKGSTPNLKTSADGKAI